MQIHKLKRNNLNKKAKRVGRGGKRGKTSGRGHKGQKAHSGRGSRPEERDMIKKLPKLRGHGKNRPRTVNPERTRPEVINISDIEKTFESGTEITPKLLAEKKLVRTKSGKVPQVKILGSGAAKKKLTFSGFLFSDSAKQKIEKAGGSIS